MVCVFGSWGEGARFRFEVGGGVLDVWGSEGEGLFFVKINRVARIRTTIENRRTLGISWIEF